MLEGGGPRVSQLDGTAFQVCLTRTSSQGGVREIKQLKRGTVARTESTESWCKRMIRESMGVRRLAVQSASTKTLRTWLARAFIVHLTVKWS